ncbi:hypothetical protein [Streptomyces himalayensis]|uniref:hypothetical protein n=1 Tax=Streptomyces himalayensis TaxID=2820085 RepID=UPI002867F9DF|nr:hypothetical protein [Streptomyces himalayensis]
MVRRRWQMVSRVRPPAAGRARVVEFQAPAEGVPGRLSWTAKQDGRPEGHLDVLHAWLDGLVRAASQ